MEYALASTSMAHTYGNVTAFITEFVKNIFPKHYFKTTHISSTIAYREFNIFQNSTKEFMKKNKPILLIRPRIELNDQDNFLYGTFLTQRITDNYMDLDFSNLQEFIGDTEKGIYMKFLLNRIKMFFDISVIVESQMEQINQVMFLKNKIRQDHNFYLETALESFVPKELLGVLASDINIPLYDENMSVKPFLDYINNKSAYPVTYKMKNSTGRDEFFRFYPAKIDTVFTNLSVDDGSKKGFISDAFTINFTISTEFNTAGLYYYFTQNPDVIRNIDLSIIADSNTIIPVFTISNLFDETIPEGWNMYSSSMYGVDSDRQPDEMDISTLFNNSLIDIIQYHIDKGIPTSVFLKISIMKDNALLDPLNNDYSIDMTKLILTTNVVNTISTYRLVVYVNTLYINNLIETLYGFTEEK